MQSIGKVINSDLQRYQQSAQQTNATIEALQKQTNEQNQAKNEQLIQAHKSGLEDINKQIQFVTSVKNYLLKRISDEGLF